MNGPEDAWQTLFTKLSVGNALRTQTLNGGQAESHLSSFLLTQSGKAVASEIFLVELTFQEEKLSPVDNSVVTLFQILGMVHVSKKGPVVICKIDLRP